MGIQLELKSGTNYSLQIIPKSFLAVLDILRNLKIAKCTHVFTISEHGAIILLKFLQKEKRFVISTKIQEG